MPYVIDEPIHPVVEEKLDGKITLEFNNVVDLFFFFGSFLQKCQWNNKDTDIIDVNTFDDAELMLTHMVGQGIGELLKAERNNDSREG